MKLAVVDHGAGNLVSIEQALVESGADVRFATESTDLHAADAVVLPGVGATGAAMNRLRDAGLTEALVAWDGPLLGICVGLQLFFETSDEDGGPCLGFLNGSVRKLTDAPRLPHIGWNHLQDRTDDPILADIDRDATFYFVHSYAPAPVDPSIVIARAEYGTPFVAAVRSGQRVGVQFHPERSGRNGMRLLANFVQSLSRADHAA